MPLAPLNVILDPVEFSVAPLRVTTHLVPFGRPDSSNVTSYNDTFEDDLAKVMAIANPDTSTVAVPEEGDAE